MKAAPVNLDVWRRLVREAVKAAEDPERPVEKLARAERAAFRATVIGVLTRDNPCVQLVRFAQQFLAAKARNRRALKPGLLGSAAQVELLLAAAIRTADPDPPGLPYRADIDG